MARQGYFPIFAFLCYISFYTNLNAQVLTPPYFNLAQTRNIEASATCGEDVAGPELFCRLTGATSDHLRNDEKDRELIRGQLCDHCNTEILQTEAVTNKNSYKQDNSVNQKSCPKNGKIRHKSCIVVDFFKEFHVAYVFIKMANSPRPGVWALLRSTDFGDSWKPWQYFADTPSDCMEFFKTPADQRIQYDDQVLCTTEFSKVVPLENGEIVISLVNERPNAKNFSYAYNLQNWTKATNIRLQFIRTKTLLGHLIGVAREDPTVTRRYYYSIKDISIGGRCVCNGHAETCDTPDVDDETKLLCTCQHNTCGDQCDTCCPGFLQKAWRRALVDQPFTCEPCECYGHTTECIYNETVANEGKSIDIHGNYDGGGVCQNCQHNTMGINCEKCVPTFYRPYGVPRNATDACRRCQCDLRISTGECEEGSGRCLCRIEFAGENCDRCNVGYYDYPNCKPCDCNINGTDGDVCTVAVGGQCPCLPNYVGRKCDMCAFGSWDFPECRPCECNPIGTPSTTCNVEDGQCQCSSNFGGRVCDRCADGFFGHPSCEYCDCDTYGTEPGVCDKVNGNCLCKANYSGERCDRCTSGYYGFPNCQACQCAEPGSRSPICQVNGQCSCDRNYGGLNCDRCAPGYYRYPDCIPCNCDRFGSLGLSCNQTTGQCKCRQNFMGTACDKCVEGFYNYPMCEECNCNPAGAKQIPGYPLGGCGEVIKGQLCECKERVQGRICDECKQGYYSLNRNNPLGCEECQCHLPGTVSGDNICDVKTGQCVCKPDVSGQNCQECRDGTFNLQENNPFGCVDCKCDPGGSSSLICNKLTGRCICKPRVTGEKCDQPIQTHFYPDLHQYKYEIEDGVTPEGQTIRYGYDERIFPSYSWRGYGILTSIQPEVLLDVEITKPSLYRMLYRFVNRNDQTVTATVTLKPESPQQITQSSQVLFKPTETPDFVNVGNGGAQSTFVLNPGRWSISTTSPDILFLDYFVLIPQSYYEATVIQDKVIRPCAIPANGEACLHYSYPDLEGYPTIHGDQGYNVVDQQRKSIEGYPDQQVLDELGVSNLGHLNPNQTFFFLDLNVPFPGDYVLVLNYYNPEDRRQDLDVDIASADGRAKAMVNLYKCQYSTVCRQVFKDVDGMIGIFNITSGYASITLRGPPNINIGIESVTAIPFEDWNPGFIQPRIICIRVNGVCVPSTYTNPGGAIRIDFEQAPNEDRLATDYPTGIIDPNIGLVKLNMSEPSIEIEGEVGTRRQFVFLIQYYQPNKVGMTVPITVYVNNQPMHGKFNAKYCPSVTGCRGTVIFDETSSEILTLKDKNVRLLVNNTEDGDLWLDYVLFVPASNYKLTDLDLQPIDKSANFLQACVNEGFELNLDNAECRDGAFTLTTEFNNGALACDCNIDGSLSFNCDSFGGQCECRPNVIGRKCRACQPGYYGFPRCKPCNCPFGLCHPVSGECTCPPRVTGERCDTCKPETYGYDALIGCQECGCNQQGVVNEDLNCDDNTGQCQCSPNIGGRKCDTCHNGYYRFPICRECDCDRSGTKSDICDQRTSQCFCKDNVAGDRCDVCADDTYFLDVNNPVGCTKCFCFGTTTRCDSSGLFWEEINDMKGWGISNTVGTQVREAGQTIALVDISDKIVDSADAMYWIAPSTYLGNRLTSYGGKLKYNILFTLPRDNPEQSLGLIKPDIILVGNNMTIVHNSESQPTANIQTDMELALIEHSFRHEIGGDMVTREQFMMILVNLQALHIRASYYTIIDEGRLTDVMLQVASSIGQGDRASNVEQCQCPPNYQGTSCEDCAPGHYRSLNSPYLGICVPCNCNGHAESCDQVTGECLNCQDNTYGTHCEFCLEGHYGNPATGRCTICSCPLPIESNNFATSCYISDETGFTSNCQCREGYYGDNCERCAPGYFGDPRTEGGYCRPCDCSGNLDMSDWGACDQTTGQCLNCQNNTGGAQCEICREWYYGDAINSKDCDRCSCDYCGSEKCNDQNGVCECKPNVVGLNCDKCAPYSYGFEECTGCRQCECGQASESPQCDVLTGQCTCRDHVLGRKCDQCQNGYWNYGSTGCERCPCMEAGSALSCDAVSGRCECLSGVTGDLCDRCLDRWVLIPGVGCQECDNCVHILIDDLDHFDRNVSVVRRQLASVSVGVGAFMKISQINDTVSLLKVNLMLILIQSISNAEAVDEDTRLLREEAFNQIQHAQEASIAAEGMLKEIVKRFSKCFMCIRSTVSINLCHSNLSEVIDEILRRMLGRIQVSYVDSYITDAEDTLTRIEAREFEAQNQTCVAENSESERAEEIEMSVMKQFGRIMNVSSDLADVKTRLYDLQNSSQFSQTGSRQTIDILRELRDINLDGLENGIEGILTGKDNSINLLDMARDLLDKSRKEMDDSQEVFLTIDRESSRLKSAVTALEVFVDNLDRGLDGMESLIGNATQHANELAEQSEQLDSMYTNTRDTAAESVNAAEAYTDIVDAINDAENASMVALESAKAALEKSGGVGDTTAKSRERSETLLSSADDAYSQTQSELSDRLAVASEQTDELMELNDKTSADLNEVHEIMDDLPDQENERSRSAIVIAEDSLSKAMEAENKISSIVDQLPEDERKAKQIPNDAFTRDRDIRKTQNQLNTIRSLTPDIKNLVGSLGQRSAGLAEIGKSVLANVTQLKERIALARDEANRIRVGLQYLANTTLTLRNPPNIEQAGSHSKVSFYFRTKNLNGFLLYLGGDQKSGRPEPDDYIALELLNGQVVFKYNLGSGAARIVSPQRVDDGMWHQVVAERIGKTGYLTIRTDKQDDTKVSGTSQGTYTVLELNPLTTVMYVGGAPDDAMLPENLLRTPYDGVIEELVFDEQPIGLWNFKDGENNYMGANERDVFKAITSNGLRFNGRGYVILSRKELRFVPAKSVDVLMKFKTYAENGLLVYMTDNKRDFLSVEIRDGQVYFQYDLGYGRATLVSGERYNDGSWHSIQASRVEKDGLLLVDGTEVAKGQSKGTLKELSIIDDIFIGGYNQPTLNTKDVMTDGFEGCIKDLQFGSSLWDLNNNRAAKGVVIGCPEQVARVVSFSALKPGFVAVSAESIGEKFDLTFKMKTFQNDSLVLFASGASNSIFSVSISEGKLVVISDPGNQRTQLESKYNKYGDGNWHYISIMKDGLKLTINIDDYETVETVADGRISNLLTTSPLYFGDIPSDYDTRDLDLPSTTRTVGCIGDVTVNMQSVNFASIKESDRRGVNLAGCPASFDGGRVPVTAGPDTKTDWITKLYFLQASTNQRSLSCSHNEKTTQPPLQCALPVIPDENLSTDVSGTRFGAKNDSRVEFEKLPARFRIKSEFSLEFKTEADNGLLFYASDPKHVDFLSLSMIQGQVVYGFNCGSGAADIRSPQKYNDGKWHMATFARAQRTGRLFIDGTEVGQGKSTGGTRSINVKPPYYVGGIPHIKEMKKAVRNLKVSNVFFAVSSFVGCIRNPTLNNKDFGTPSQEYQTSPCSDAMESGTFFPADAYMLLFDNFKVGLDKEIYLEIKPRVTSGVILAVHSKGGDFFAIQLVNGKLIFNTDNGAGMIQTEYTPTAQNALCDGNWHTIKATKAKNVASLEVDGVQMKQGIGKAGSSEANTNDPIYVGGVPTDGIRKGLFTEENYVGCIRNMWIDGKVEFIGNGKPMGDVQILSCPRS
ncbi:hypothetical protein LOTGIDRAFT_144813 [Lottia gigantea]|uniref:Laminin subunit alpha-1 n=1 Tax=Lottia gigantea TaxID=225164 RepID=V4AMT0_LOTGI|nr:hypothetical protein LOTGIDRAFT_144813 [Lottia gigantea]ESO94906.1 hypothetical protein LOTGIDRAFT_144813 [Lottia gigantea]